MTRKCSGLLATTLLVAVGASSAQATPIYHELFHGPGGGMTQIGWWYQLDYGPNTKYTQDGTDPWGGSYSGWNIGGPGATGGSDMGIGSINSNPVAPDADENGYLYAPIGGMNASIYYQHEHEIDLAQWKDFVVSFDTYDDTVGSTYRVLVGISATSGGAPTAWYVSGVTDTTNINDANDGDSLIIDTTGADWYTLTANYLQGSLVGALPGGYAVAFGFQSQNATATTRVDNFLIDATFVPEPASVGLLSAVALAFVGRRRR